MDRPFYSPRDHKSQVKVAICFIFELVESLPPFGSILGASLLTNHGIFIGVKGFFHLPLCQEILSICLGQSPRHVSLTVVKC